MFSYKALTLLVVVVQVLSQDDKSQQPVPAYDPQLLNYQLALQQYSGLQGQVQPYETQPAQFPSTQQQGVTGSGEAQQYSTLQALDQYLQQRQYQTQVANAQAVKAVFQQTQPQLQTQPQKQSLLGVAYSSAADASRTSFTGYGIKYSF